MRKLARRFSALLHRRRLRRELDEEMAAHLAMMPADRRAQFGSPLRFQEQTADQWGWTSLDRLRQDLSYGARSLRRSPGFTLVATIALALGVGANTAIFTVVNAVLLRPLDYQDPGRLVTILHQFQNPVSVANYIDWRDQSRSFETMAAADYWSPNLTGRDTPEHLYGLKVTQNLLPMLDIDPLLGRWFAPGEDQAGAEHEVILSYRLWQRRFNSDRGVVGSSVTFNGESYTVVGVMPPEFRFAPFWATRAELWVPLAFGDRIHNRGGNSLRIFARLKPSVQLAEARAEIAGVTARLERQYPGTNRQVEVTPLKENVVGRVETPMLIVLGAVGFVLLIACANVAHMLLARTSERQREIAVRTALGASRARVIRQFLTENLLLAACGGAAGLLLAVAGTKSLMAVMPATMPRLETVAIDGQVVVFLLAITVLALLVFGLAPAFRASVANLSGSLKEGGRGGSDGSRRNRLRGFLVASECALAFVLLIGAGLMIRSFAALRSVDPGFNPRHVLSMVVSVAGSAESAPERRELFYRELLARVGALPGVESAGAINHLPLAGDLWGWPFAIEGRPKSRPGESPRAIYRIAMPGYFETMRLPLVRGRAMTAHDDSHAPGVVVINERAAARFWPGQDPLGKRISFDDDKHNPRTWLTVIGIAKNAKQDEWARAPEPEVYLAALQNREFLETPGPHMAYLTLVIRTTGAAADIAPAVKRTVWSFDRNLPISEVLTMDSVVDLVNAQPRFEMFLLGVFGGVALLLAAVGIYGVMNYSIARRTHEIGIRVALGASRAEVFRMVMLRGAAQALAGSAAGILGALLLARLMTRMLYGVRPDDPLTFGGVAAVMGLAAVIAVFVPARRAARIEPANALRNE